jgi:hypothetical protein
MERRRYVDTPCIVTRSGSVWRVPEQQKLTKNEECTRTTDDTAGRRRDTYLTLIMKIQTEREKEIKEPVARMCMAWSARGIGTRCAQSRRVAAVHKSRWRQAKENISQKSLVGEKIDSKPILEAGQNTAKTVILNTKHPFGPGESNPVLLERYRPQKVQPCGLASYPSRVTCTSVRLNNAPARCVP